VRARTAGPPCVSTLTCCAARASRTARAAVARARYAPPVALVTPAERKLNLAAQRLVVCGCCA